MFNTSTGRFTYGNEIEINVKHVTQKSVKNKTTTRYYPMTRNPRGKAIIVNVVPNAVKREHLRFAHIFKEFKFNVICRDSMSTTDIIEMLYEIKDEVKGDEALMVMIITHGSDDEIVGKNHEACGGKDKNDIVNIRQIVDIFADIGDTVKIFFFTCCRDSKQNITWLELIRNKVFILLLSSGASPRHDAVQLSLS